MNSLKKDSKLEDIVGEYRNDIYGDIEFKIIENNFRVQFEHHPKIFGYLTQMEDSKLTFDLTSHFFEKAQITIHKVNELQLTFPIRDPNQYTFSRK